MPKDDSTWLNVSYVVFAILLYYVCTLAFDTAGVQLGWTERFEWYGWAAKAVSLLIAAGGTLGLRANKERHEFLLSSIAELRKVMWPSLEDTRKMTTIVVVVVAVFAVILTSFDFLWAKVLRWMLA